MGKIHIQKIVREELSHLTEEQKRKILHDLDESKVTPAKVSKAFTKVAEISKLMITNLEKYKSAKSSGDENAIAKHTKIAGDLTKKKKAAESEANSLIAQLDRDVELSLEGIKEIVSEEYDKLTEISKEEKAAQFKLKLFLKKGLRLSVKDGEDKLYDYAEELDRLADDEYNEVVDPLYAALELVQDAGVPGVNDVEDDKEYRMYIKSADKHMKTFIKNAKKTISRLKEGKLNEDNKLAKIVDKNLKQGMKNAKFIKLIGKQPIFTAIDKNNKKVDITLTKKGNIQKYADFKKWGADLGQVYGNIKGDVKKLNKFEKRPYYESVDDFIIEGKLTESMIGIQTKANFKPLQLKGALERAGIKGFQMNRLSVTLTALKLDKKYYKEAMKIIDALRLKVMMAKESVNEVRVKKGDAIKMKDGEIGVVNKVKGRVAYIKLDSMPGSFHPIEAAEITYKGKHKGKDLYNEASSIWKALDAKWKLYDESMDIENDLRNITLTIKQLHKNMEQEAEPEGGKVADRYGREIEKYEKMYKKRKAEFKKVSAKIDKMEQY